MTCAYAGTTRSVGTSGDGGPADSGIQESCGERTADCLIGRLREVVRSVSGREREVLGHIVRGATCREIARHMDVSLHTVDTYMRRIRAKTGARNPMHLLLLALSVEVSLVSAVEGMRLSAMPKPPAGPRSDRTRARLPDRGHRPNDT
ncbi:response regulator transcription factor [Streptomyces sp. NPDC059063]|uniref:response regulator transcription factor n=1 Tax=unclassified Streptomyces TaxID=2593676 RepID=UPI0036B0ACD7